MGSDGKGADDRFVVFFYFMLLRGQLREKITETQDIHDFSVRCFSMLAVCFCQFFCKGRMYTCIDYSGTSGIFGVFGVRFLIRFLVRFLARSFGARKYGELE